MSAILLLRSSSNEEFLVEQDVIAKSETLNTMIRDLGLADMEDPVPIPLPNVDSGTLKKVLEWCRYHKDDKVVAPQDESKKDEVPEWDKELLSVNNTKLIKIYAAANYLNIPALINNAAQLIANQLKGKTAAEIRATFNIKCDDLTAEEKAQIQAENDWIAD